jgi:hypothetical protein
MGKADYYKDGDYNGICDQCGFKYKFSKLKKTWNGLYTCSKCFEIRNPQDYVRGVRDQQSVPVDRPETPDEFVDVTFIDY